jgi:transcriptional regulator with XRE-family HTH domain
MKKFNGDEIRRLRKEMGLGQKEFGMLLGTYASNISYWETGKHIPNTQNVERLREIGRQNGYELDLFVGIQEISRVKYQVLEIDTYIEVTPISEYHKLYGQKIPIPKVLIPDIAVGRRVDRVKYRENGEEYSRWEMVNE